MGRIKHALWLAYAGHNCRLSVSYFGLRQKTTMMGRIPNPNAHMSTTMLPLRQSTLKIIGACLIDYMLINLDHTPGRCILTENGTTSKCKIKRQVACSLECNKLLSCVHYYCPAKVEGTSYELAKYRSPKTTQVLDLQFLNENVSAWHLCGYSEFQEAGNSSGTSSGEEDE